MRNLVVSEFRKAQSWVLFVMMGLVVMQSGLVMAAEDKKIMDDKINVGVGGLVQVAKEVRSKIVQIVIPLENGGGNVGSGFWVDELGYIATSWHVVKDNPTGNIKVLSAIDPYFDLKKNNVVVSNAETFTARVVAKDEKKDLALLKVDVSPFGAKRVGPIRIAGEVLSAHYKKASLKTELPEPGQKILLAGCPLGLTYPVVQEGTVASIIAEGGDTVGGSFVKILVSTVANPGNSGGPVFDSDGEVIGVLEGVLPSKLGQSGIAVVVPSYYLLGIMNNSLRR